MAEDKAKKAPETAIEPVESALAEGVEELVEKGVEDPVETIGLPEQLEPLASVFVSQP